MQRGASEDGSRPRRGCDVDIPRRRDARRRYGPALKEQNGTLSETVSKIIPAPEVVGQFLAVVVGVDGLLKYFRRVRGRVAATPRPRRGYFVETRRGGAAAATWLFRGDNSRRRRGRDVDVPGRRVAAAPRPRRARSVETGARLRYFAADGYAAFWGYRGRVEISARRGPFGQRFSQPPGLSTGIALSSVRKRAQCVVSNAGTGRSNQSRHSSPSERATAS